MRLDRKRLARAVKWELSNRDDEPYTNREALRIADALAVAYESDAPAELDVVLSLPKIDPRSVEDAIKSVSLGFDASRCI